MGGTDKEILVSEVGPSREVVEGVETTEGVTVDWDEDIKEDREPEVEYTVEVTAEVLGEETVTGAKICPDEDDKLYLAELEVVTVGFRAGRDLVGFGLWLASWQLEEPLGGQIWVRKHLRTLELW